MKANITCKQAVHYISKKEEGKLSAWKRFQLWKHLAGCSLCRLFNVQNKVITKALSDAATPAEPLTQQQKTEIAQAVLNKNL